MADLTSPNPPSATVTYDVGQLLDMMRRETSLALERIETKLDSKADKADLVELRKDLEFHGERLSKLEIAETARQVAHSATSKQAETTQQRRNRQREFVMGLIMTALTIGLVLGALGVHI